jgi:putative transposase
VRRAIASMLTEHDWPIAPSPVRAFHTRPVSSRQCRDEDLVEHIARVHKDNDDVFGARRVWLTLEREGIAVARCTASG